MSTRVCPTSGLGGRWYDYEVNLDNGVYYADPNIRKSGLRTLRNTSLVDLWDAMNAEQAFARAYGRATFVDPFIVDGVLRVTSDATVTAGLGPGATVFQAGVDLNDHMFEWDSGDYYYNVLFKDFYMDGNSGNQSGGGPYRGIHQDITAACTSAGDHAYHAYLYNLTIRDCKGHGYYLRTNTGVNTAIWMAYCRIATNGGGGETAEVSIERMFDGQITHNYIASMRLLKSITTCHFEGNYYGGGGERKVVEYSGCTEANPAHGNIHNGDFFDNVANGNNAESGCLVIEDYSWNIKFKGCTFGRNAASSTAGVGPQVLIIDDATHHRFLACDWYHPGDVTRTFSYAVVTLNNADWNRFSGSISQHDRPGSGVDVYANDPVFWLFANANDDTTGLVVQ